MSPPPTPSYTAFAGVHRIASGNLAEVARAVREAINRHPQTPVLIFDDASGRQIDVDLRGSPEEVAARVRESPGQTPGPATPRVRGRPKLGVVAREVTLLPRHWAWLNVQPGGASATLRRLVEDARRGRQASERARRASDAVFYFMNTMAGNLPGYEEALRAFYRGDETQFESRIEDWPHDIREHIRYLSAVARDTPTTST